MSALEFPAAHLSGIMEPDVDPLLAQLGIGQVLALSVRSNYNKFPSVLSPPRYSEIRNESNLNPMDAKISPFSSFQLFPVVSRRQQL
jgi:hypothetical protein